MGQVFEVDIEAGNLRRDEPPAAVPEVAPGPVNNIIPGNTVLVGEEYVPLSTRIYFIERVLGALVNLLVNIVHMCISTLALPFVLSAAVLVPSFALAALSSIEDRGIKKLLSAFNGFMGGLFVVPFWAAGLGILVGLILTLAAIPIAVMTAIKPFYLLYQGYQKGVRRVLNDRIAEANIAVKLSSFLFNLLKSNMDFSAEAVLDSALALIKASWHAVVNSSDPVIEKLEYKALEEHLYIKKWIKSIESPSPENGFPVERSATMLTVKEAQRYYASMQTRLFDKYNATGDLQLRQEIESVYDLYCQKLGLLNVMLTALRKYTPLSEAPEQMWDALNAEAMLVRNEPVYVGLSQMTSDFLMEKHLEVYAEINGHFIDRLDLEFHELPIFRRRVVQAAVNAMGQREEEREEVGTFLDGESFRQTLLLPQAELNEFKHTRYSAAEIQAYKDLAVDANKKTKIDALLHRYEVTDARLLSDECGVGMLEIESADRKYILTKQYKETNERFLPIPDTDELANTVVQVDTLAMWCARNATHPYSRDKLVSPNCTPYQKVKGEGQQKYDTQYKVHPYYQHPASLDLADKDKIYSQEQAFIEGELNKICPRSDLQLPSPVVAQTAEQRLTTTGPIAAPAAGSVKTQTVAQLQRETARNARLIKFGKFFSEQPVVDPVDDSTVTHRPSSPPAV